MDGMKSVQSSVIQATRMDAAVAIMRYDTVKLVRVTEA
jgi:hypothetical protein